MRGMDLLEFRQAIDLIVFCDYEEKWRRDRDSNPGCLSPGTTVFETAPIDRSGIPPRHAGGARARVI